MNEWFSAAEVAALPGTPDTVQGVIKAAKREDWKWQPRKAGKGREYHLSSLPSAAREQLSRDQAAAIFNEQAIANEAAIKSHLQRREANLANFSRQAPHKKERARAREWVLLKIGELRRDQPGLTVDSAVKAFCALYRAGEIAMPDKHRAWMPRYAGAVKLNPATVFRWQTAYRKQGLAGLTDGYGNRARDSKIERNPELKKAVLGAILSEPHIGGIQIKQYLQARHPELNTVSTRVLQRYIKTWKADNHQIWTLLTHPDQWKNIYLAAFGSQSEAVTRLNQLWELDSTPADWMLADGRHNVIACIDVYSRRLRYRVSRTSTAAAVCALTRRCVLDWGVPEAVRTDNGADYVSEQFEEVLRGLEIHHELCIPFASEQKATVERSMQTMSHGILDLLPGFIGHNVAERKQIEGRKAFAARVMDKDAVIEVAMSADELQQKLDEWCEHVYERNGHAGLDGRTPFEAAAAWQQPVRRIADERALDGLLAPLAGTRTVAKKGVRLEHYWYLAPALVEHIGDVVRVKLDETDIGRIYVYALDGAFVCTAEAPEITGTSRAELAAAAKAHQKKFTAEQSQELRAFKRAQKENKAEVILAHRIEQSEKTTALPPTSEPYTTPALTEAGKAARAGDGPQIETVAAEDKARQADIAADLAAPKVTALEETSRARYQRWVRLQRRAVTQTVSADEQRFINSYAQQTECRIEHEMHAGFGLLVDGVAPEFEPAPAKANARHGRA